MAAPLHPMLMAALHMWGEKEGSTPLGRSKDQVLGCKASWARQAVPHLPGMCAARVGWGSPSRPSSAETSS